RILLNSGWPTNWELAISVNTATSERGRLISRNPNCLAIVDWALREFIDRKARQATENPRLTSPGRDSDPASLVLLSLPAIEEEHAPYRTGHAAYPVEERLTNGTAAPGRFPAGAQSRTVRLS